jgi:hypothetical protein
VDHIEAWSQQDRLIAAGSVDAYAAKIRTITAQVITAA